MFFRVPYGTHCLYRRYASFGNAIRGSYVKIVPLLEVIVCGATAATTHATAAASVATAAAASLEAAVARRPNFGSTSQKFSPPDFPV